MDHKRALDGDEGPNTGGMGTDQRPTRITRTAIAAECMETIFLPTIAAMRAEGSPFNGCLYFGLMLTPDGPKVIEYNCRFGDPETQVVSAAPQNRPAGDHAGDRRAPARRASGGISRRKRRLRRARAAAATRSSTKPAFPSKGSALTGRSRARPSTTRAPALRSGVYKTAGGRVLGVTCTAPTAGEALRNAYRAAEGIRFEGVHFRRDIGARNHR